ncbi:isoprenylcysteine carboxylmethyltransferase family protein [Nocardia sp. NPDC051030]|uniref:methyltransferase family protein n=1 Tax=Nocardia sp. NPDC051030 TaxID=3155162 RepID=UPI00341E10FB
MGIAIVTTWVWLALEIGLRVRDRVRGIGSTARDGGTRATIMVLIAAANAVVAVIAFALPTDSPLWLPGPYGFWVVLGVAVMWFGLAVRVWAIAVLGKAFRTTVEVDADQAVVDSGPYRWIRHPSYIGVLLLTVGFGLAAANWISLPIAIVVPAIALYRRIDVEEKALIETLGRPYEDYRAGTKRLVPGVW